MGTKDYLLQQTAFQKRVSTSGPPLVRKVIDWLNNGTKIKYFSLLSLGDVMHWYTMKEFEVGC
jgi:hypothetical protein